MPSTLRKQLVVWPIPLGSTRSLNMALTTVLLPLLVLKPDKKQTLAECGTKSFAHNSNHSKNEHMQSPKMMHHKYALAREVKLSNFLVACNRKRYQRDRFKRLMWNSSSLLNRAVFSHTSFYCILDLKPIISIDVEHSLVQLVWNHLHRMTGLTEQRHFNDTGQADERKQKRKQSCHMCNKGKDSFKSHIRAIISAKCW